MHNHEPPEKRELRDIAFEIEQRRQHLGLSKNALCQKFGQLGSTKTYGRILDVTDELEGLNVLTQLQNFRVARELLLDFKEDPEESKIYADFTFIKSAMDTVGEALQQNDNTRLVLVTGESGSGKSTLLDQMQQSDRTRSIVWRVEATEAWRESSFELLGAILGTVGIFERQPEGEKKKDADSAMPRTPGGRLAKLVQRLNGNRAIIAIDEGHHIGAAGYNIVKSIINQTRAVVVLTAIPEIIQRINKNAYAEATQLFRNRLYEHVRFGAPQAGEVIEFMRRRGVGFAGPKIAASVAEKIASEAKHFGNWKYAVRCTREARRKSAEPFTAEQFMQVILDVKNKISLGG